MTLPDWMKPYLMRVHEEYVRIGFTEEELSVQAADEMPDESRFQRILDDLATVPSGIGAKAYYERHGVDYEPLRRAVEEFREYKRRQSP